MSPTRCSCANLWPRPVSARATWREGSWGIWLTAAVGSPRNWPSSTAYCLRPKRRIGVPLHRAWRSVGERLLGNVHKPLFRRAAKEGSLRRSIGSEGAGGRLPRALQPQQATQYIGLPDSRAQFAEATDLESKVEDGGKPEELESVLTLS